MKKLLTIFAPLLCFVLPASAAESEVATYRLNVEPFVELNVVDGVKVDCYLRADSAGMASFRCAPEVASQIMFSNKDGRLTIRTGAEETPIIGVPCLTVYTASLVKVENSGDSLVCVHGPIVAKTFKARQIGNGSLEIRDLDVTQAEAGVTAGKGSLTISGKAGKAKLSNVSTGPVDASGLLSDNVNCFIFGPGNIHCNPVRQLRVYGAGSGKVVYHTTPEKVTHRGLGVKATSIDSLDVAANDRVTNN
ncbi:MAG: DUF2807 domain-containing protein [Muribaculaceae bacterium]|nr:DUF2807 domain-containing protein [Muribaculaceae bacterium]